MCADMTKMTIEEILNHCEKFDGCSTKPRMNQKTFWDKAKKGNWLVVDSISEKEKKIIELLKKIGFEQEAPDLPNTFISKPIKDGDKTVYYKAIIGTWFNDYYNNICGQFSWSKSEEYPRTVRIGETFRENGVLKTKTRHGTWTGD